MMYDVHEQFCVLFGEDYLMMEDRPVERRVFTLSKAWGLAQDHAEKAVDLYAGNQFISPDGLILDADGTLIRYVVRRCGSSKCVRECIVKL